MPLETSLTPSPSSPPSSGTPTTQLAAVSQAISQSVPPNPQGGKRSLDNGGRVNNGQNEQSTNRSSTSSTADDKTVSLEDFDSDANEINQPSKIEPATKSVEKPGKAENKETEEGQDQPTDEEVDNKLDLEIDLNEEDPAEKLKKQEEVSKVKSTRDYSKFKPEHAEYLKRLPNHLFNKASEEFLKLYGVEAENKELKAKLEKNASGQLPDSYYEHPDAFQLTPKYQELQEQARYDNFEESHWIQQLVRLERGQDWRLLVGYTEAGEPQYQVVKALAPTEEGAPSPVDVENKIKVANWIQQIQANKRDRQSQMAVLKHQHVESHTKSTKGVKELESKFFKAFEDESKLPLVVKADLQMASKAFEETAPAFKGNPLSSLVIKSYAALKAQNRQIIKLAEMLNKVKSNKEDSIKAGPGREDFRGGGGNVNGDKVLSESMFED